MVIPAPDGTSLESTGLVVTCLLSSSDEMAYDTI